MYLRHVVCGGIDYLPTLRPYTGTLVVRANVLLPTFRPYTGLNYCYYLLVILQTYLTASTGTANCRFKVLAVIASLRSNLILTTANS